MAKSKKGQEQLNGPAGAASRSIKASALEVAGKSGGSPCCGPRTYYAVLETDGTLIRGHGVWRATRLATGQYEVVFIEDVSNGAYTATIGRPGIFTEPTGQIGVALRFGLAGPEANKGVWIDTHDSDGNRSDRAFHLIVTVS